MKGSGITRRIDELGRIVVPKEMRYNLGIREGEPLEISVDDNKIIIKKFSQVENIKDISTNLCNIIRDTCNVNIMISDREKIIASSLNEKINEKLAEVHKRLIDERLSYKGQNEEEMYNIKGYYAIIPIITANDCCGLIFIIANTMNNYLVNYAKIVEKLIVQKLDGI